MHDQTNQPSSPQQDNDREIVQNEHTRRHRPV